MQLKLNRSVKMCQVYLECASLSFFSQALGLIDKLKSYVSFTVSNQNTAFISMLALIIVLKSNSVKQFECERQHVCMFVYVHPRGFAQYKQDRLK